MKNDPQRPHPACEMAVNMMIRELGVERNSLMIFTLNTEYTILFCNDLVNELLRYEEKLTNTNFTALVARHSVDAWQDAANMLNTPGHRYSGVELLLRTYQVHLLPVFCLIATPLLSAKEIHIIAIKKYYASRPLERRLNLAIETFQEQLDSHFGQDFDLDTPPQSTMEWIAYMEALVLSGVALPPLEEFVRGPRLTIDAFKEAFKQVKGVTLKRFIVEIRVQQAKKMLIEPEDSIQKVAKKLHYKLAAFTRMFKRETGLTPSSYRRQQRLLKRENPPNNPP